jgi:hypothetical protein
MKKIFTYEEAAALLPRVRELTADAVARVEELEEDAPAELYQSVLDEWAAQIMAMGVEVKGLWLIDFDNGSGYYCWHHPEASLQFFHGYDEGFGGRVQLN